jgi:hypothetical protein
MVGHIRALSRQTQLPSIFRRLELEILTTEANGCGYQAKLTANPTKALRSACARVWILQYGHQHRDKNTSAWFQVKRAAPNHILRDTAACLGQTPDINPENKDPE